MSRGRVLCIVGPTAVGKSALAERVANELNGEIVSTDSMQVYRGMDIGTAKAAPDQRTVVLHMVDVADPCENYSVARFQHDARRCIDALLARKVVPVLCGGTGLYLDAVVDEMSFPHGETGGKARSTYEDLASREGAHALHDLLRSRDRESAELIHPNNVRRVVRALELLDEGTSYAKNHEGLLKRERHYDTRVWALSVPRPQLYRAIDRRVDEMFEAGLVDEVRALAAKGLDSTCTAGQAIGYKELLGAIAGDHSLEESRELIKRNTRRYAKRQLSWIRRDGRARWLDMTEKTPDEAVRLIIEDWRAS